MVAGGADLRLVVDMVRQGRALLLRSGKGAAGDAWDAEEMVATWRGNGLVTSHLHWRIFGVPFCSCLWVPAGHHIGRIGPLCVRVEAPFDQISL